MARSIALAAVTAHTLLSFVRAHGCGSDPINTLTLDCSSCSGERPSCIYFDRSSTVPTSCDYDSRSPGTSCIFGDTCDIECFPKFENDTEFKFAVLDASTRSRNITARAPPPFGIFDSPPPVPFETDEFLDRIGRLTMANTVKTVAIFGGPDQDKSDISPIIITMDTNWLEDAPQVQSVVLKNLEIADPQLSQGLKPLALPSGLISLDLTNTNLDAIPPDLSTLTALNELTLVQNKLKSIPSSLKLNQLLKLNLRRNEILVFEAVFPSLRELNMNSNNLTVIPTTVFDHANLRALNVRNNPLRSLTLSKAQFDFLDNLDSLLMDTAHIETICGQRNVQLASTSAKKTAGTLSKLCDAKGHSSNGEELGKTMEDDNSAPSISERNLIIGMCLAVGFIAVITVFVVLRKRLIAAAAAPKAYNSEEDTMPSGIVTGGTNYDLIVGNEAPNITTGGSNASRQSVDENWIKSSHFDLRSIRMAVREIEDVRVIGSSSSTVTWLVNYRKNTLFASKRLLVAENSIESKAHNERRAKFLSEVHIAAPLNHPSIVSLVGVAWTNESDLQVLYEYMANGDLQSYLADETATTWQPSSLAMAIDIIEALVYAHSFNPPLVHRDLKSRNVLLDEEMKAKVACFGDARFASENGTMTSDGVGSSRWLAPEILAGSSTYDASADVYAFGVLLSELDTHQLPYEERLVGGTDSKSSSTGDGIGEMELLLRVIRGEERPRFSDECPLEIVELAMQCMATDSRDRPTGVQVAYRLRMMNRRGDRSSHGTLV